MTKLSQITPAGSNPSTSDTLVGVTGGSDRLFTVGQLGATLSLLPPNTQTGSSYTLALGDVGGIVEMNNAGANTCTIPPNSSVAFPVGTEVDIVQIGAGTTAVAAGSGVTILSGLSGGGLSVPGQYSGVTLYQRASNTWVLLG